MNIQQLTYIVEIANCKSISRAAEYLFVSQPALSQQIRNLEKEPFFRIRNKMLERAGHQKPDKIGPNPAL